MLAGLGWLTMAAGMATGVDHQSVAQTQDPADGAIRRGLALRRQGLDTQALQEFQKANEISPSPRALVQIGWAEQALGRWPDAEAHLQSAIKGSRDPWIRKALPTIEESLSAIATHLGSLDIIGSPAQAEVSIDGHVVGKVPLAAPVRVTAGDIVLELRHPGYRTISRTVKVNAGNIARESIVLVPITPEGAARLSTPAIARADAAMSNLPAVVTPQARVDRAPAITESRSNASSFVPVSAIRIAADGVVDFMKLSGRRVTVPALLGVKISGTYAVRLPAAFVDVGIVGTFTPLGYDTDTMSSETSYLWGAFGVGRYRYPFGNGFHIACSAAAGIVWWSGLKNGDPFTAAHAGSDGPIPMPSLRTGVEGSFNLGRGLFLTAGPSYLFSKTTSPGLTTAISSMSALELSAGAGYTF